MVCKQLARCCKISLTGGCLCLAAVYLVAVPGVAAGLLRQAPELADRFWPWLLLVEATALPCILVALWGWKLTGEIGRGNAFSGESARLVKRTSTALLLDAALFLAGNVVYFLLGISHPAVALLALFVCAAAAVFGLAARALAQLVGEAARLREDSELVI